MRIVWSDDQWIWPAIGVFVILALLVTWSYLRTPAIPRWVRIAAAGLKLLGFLALILFLLGPEIVQSVAKPGTNWLAVLADTSESMSIADQTGGATRGQAMQELLANPATLEPLKARYQLRNFTFDTHLRRTDAFDGLTFTGPSSGLIAALGRIASQFQGQPLAGIVVVTDGMATDFATDLPENLPPVFPVVISSGRTPVDAAIDDISIRETVFENAPITIDATAHVRGMQGRRISARLLDDTGRVVEEQPRNATSDSDLLNFRFLVTPSKSGSVTYRIELIADGDEIPANNAASLVANRTTGPFRILYVSGAPNWEHKFLQRALENDPEIRLVSLIRVARGETKANWREGSSGGRSHPFYQGQVDDDEAERYDEPVLMRIGTRDETELRGGFPREAAELFEYDAVVLDNIEAPFFSHEQMSLIRRFVAERGGSLLMLGGIDSLDAGDYADTAVADTLPVYLKSSDAAAPSPPLKIELTEAGMLEPFVRLRRTATEEAKRVEAMPPLLVGHQLPSLKPGAQAQALFRDAAGTTAPAIATQRFGKGRTMVTTVGDWWRWGMESPRHRKDMETFWRQFFREALSDVPRRASIAVSGLANGQATVTVTALDETFRPSPNVAINARVLNPHGEWSRLEMRPDPGKPGTFTAQVAAKEAGAWQVEAIVTDPSDNQVTKVQTGWAENPAARELRASPTENTELARIAAATGGRVLRPEELESIVDQLKSKPQPVMETRTSPLWHHGAWLALALGCFIGEWALRRWKGLA